MAEKFEFSKEEFKKQVKDYVKVVSRKNIEEASQLDIYTGVAYGLKDYIIDQWIATHKEYEEKGQACELEALKEEIRARDAQDCGRVISPLKKADDAIEVDTTHMGIDEIVEHIATLLNERL